MSELKDFEISQDVLKKYSGTEEVVFIPHGVYSIEKEAFWNSDKTCCIVVPEGVEVINKQAFQNCKYLHTVILPDTLKEIHSEAFVSCIRLSAIYVSGQNPVYKSLDGVLFSADGKTLIRFPARKSSPVIHSPREARELTIDSSAVPTYGYEIPKGVTAVGDYAFGGCTSVEEIIIPDSVCSIGEKAFEGCSRLKKIELPNSIRSISKYAFQSCRCLEEIIIPDSAEEIQTGAFFGSGLKQVSVPENAKIAETAYLYGGEISVFPKDTQITRR